MSEKPEIHNEITNGISRRQFLQTVGALALGGAAAVHGLLAPQNSGGQDKKEMKITEESLKEHIREGGVEWTTAKEMLEKHRLDCIDGRCEECAAGSPGGDMGDLFLKLTASEQVSGKKIESKDVPGIFERYLKHHKGPFYMHTDDHSFANLAKRMGIPVPKELPKKDEKDPEWIKKLRTLMDEPGDRTEELLNAMVEADTVGCGHLKLVLLNPELYPGARPELLKSLIRTYTERKLKKEKMDYVVLRGNHEEVAVMSVVMDGGELEDDSPVPLIKPTVGKSSVFIVYPQVEEYSEGRFAEIASEVTGIQGIDGEKLKAKMRELRGKYLASSATKLGAGDKPSFVAHYTRKGEPIDVKKA